jgi:hypothetical protein
LKVDNGWNVGALWTGRIKALLVSAGVTVSPFSTKQPHEDVTAWTGKLGVSVAYST